MNAEPLQTYLGLTLSRENGDFHAPAGKPVCDTKWIKTLMHITIN